MSRQTELLLLVDGIINLLLGAALLLSPAGFAQALRLPPFATSFYPTLLGAVLFGIGLALLVERYAGAGGAAGLGADGAVAINLCGGGVLLLWLIAGDLTIPLRGRIILWTVTVVVLLLAVVEVAAGAWWEGRHHG